MYAKLINGEPVEAPPGTPQEVLNALGYKELVYTDAPDVEDGYQAVEWWDERAEKIVQSWWILPVPAPPKPEDMIAQDNIPADEYFQIGETMFLSTGAIAKGQTIRPGINCTQVDLINALNTLKEVT